MTFVLKQSLMKRNLRTSMYVGFVYGFLWLGFWCPEKWIIDVHTGSERLSGYPPPHSRRPSCLLSSVACISLRMIFRWSAGGHWTRPQQHRLWVHWWWSHMWGTPWTCRDWNRAALGFGADASERSWVRTRVFRRFGGRLKATRGGNQKCAIIGMNPQSVLPWPSSMSSNTSLANHPQWCTSYTALQICGGKRTTSQIPYERALLCHQPQTRHTCSRPLQPWRPLTQSLCCTSSPMDVILRWALEHVWIPWYHHTGHLLKSG